MERPAHEERGSLVGVTVGDLVIRDLIGAGGMGEVYRAWDSRLKRLTAVKALSPALVSNPIARRRFARELRVACQVSHPYVTTVLDVVEHGNELLLVMEYVDGEPLSRIIRRAPPDRDRVLGWGLQIAEALAAIHAAGVVHRDVKPGNVMITRDGHVKVTDFGVAQSTFRPVEPGSAESTGSTLSIITEHGHVVGTPLYMSPEQLRSEPIDARSDLFSLGTMLYETVAGAHPFARGTLAESAVAIMYEPPGGDSQPDSFVRSGPIREIALRLLQKEPSRRYQSAEEVVADLHAASDGLMVHALRVRRRRLSVAGAAAVALAIAATAMAIVWLLQPPRWDQPRFALAMLPFQDKTSGPQGDLNAQMLADFVAADLEGSHLVRVRGADHTKPLVAGLAADSSRGDIVGRINAGLSVDYVLIGKLYSEGDLYVATLDFESTRGELPELNGIRATSGSIVDLAENVASIVRRSLPDVSTLTAWRDDRIGIEEITSSSEDARLFYERALIAQRDGKLQDAASWLDKAVGADPEFALAFARLAQVHDATGYSRLARDAAARAVTVAPEPDSPAAEKISLMIEATQARANGRHDDAADAWGRLVTRFPDEPDSMKRYASALLAAGNSEGALTQVDRALELEPLDASLHRLRAQSLVGFDRHDEALADLERAEELSRDVESEEGIADARLERGKTYKQMERYADAVEEMVGAAGLYAASGRDVSAASALLAAAEVDVVRGMASAAEEHTQAAEAIARRVGNRSVLGTALTARGAQLYRQGAFADAEPVLAEAIDVARQLENDHLLISPLSNLSNLLAYLGRRAEAAPLLEESAATADRLGLKEAAMLARITLSDIEYQQGNLELAAETYRRLIDDATSDDGSGVQRLTGWALLGVSEIESRRGRLADALSAADRAVEIAREISGTGLLGYGLAQRAWLRGAVGRNADAVPDLDEAEGIAAAAGAGLQDLTARAAVVRAALELYQGNWRESLEHAERAASGPGSDAPVIQATASSVACAASIELGRGDAAVASCREAANLEAAPLADRVDARALLAQALASNGDNEAAREESLAALESARRLELLLAHARSAAVLVSLGEDERTLEEGRQAFQNYVAHAPEDDRERVVARADVLSLKRVLRLPQ